MPVLTHVFPTSNDFEKVVNYDSENKSSSTGWELDSETGYSYFGARYMDHELMTMWLSVDPMADKYPNISPYAFCAWNPMKLVDPNGMNTIVGVDLNNGKTFFWYDDKTSNCSFVEFYKGENLIDDYKCNGKISIKSNTNVKRTTLSFTDDKDASSVFDVLTGNSDLNYASGVEWNYYKKIDGSGDLVTSQIIDKIFVTNMEYIYNDENVINYHHYHPYLPGYDYWTPSEEDQEYAKSLGVPCFLHFTGQSYRFDDIVNKYGVMPYPEFQKHVPLTIFK